MSHPTGAADERAADTPTPFYDHLMSMIDATALESSRAAQDHEAVAPRIDRHRWRIHPLVPCIAGLVVVAAVGRILLVSEESQMPPPVVMADAENVREDRSRLLDNATTTDDQVPRPEQAAGPDSSEGGIGAGGARTDDGGNGVVAARPDARPMAPSIAEQPIESPGAEAEAAGDGPAVAARASTEATETDPVASPTGQTTAADSTSEQPLRADAPALLPSAIETGSVGQVGNPAAIRVARVVTDVNLRAGPSNGQAVIGRVARGRPVDVITCRQWCEVVYAGQRGWVYKAFIDPPPAPDER
jgi:hypothetical protein